MINISIAGFGYGVCMVTTLSAAWTHYPENKGTVTGIILSSHGFSGFILNYIILFLTNPDNLKATISVLEGN